MGLTFLWRWCILFRMTTILLWSCLLLFTVAVTVLAAACCRYAWQLRTQENAEKRLFQANLAVADYRHAVDTLSALWKTEQPKVILFILFPEDTEFLLGVPSHRRRLSPTWIPAILEFARDLNITILYTPAVFTMSTPGEWFLKDSGVLIKEMGIAAEGHGERLLIVGIDTEQKMWCHFAGQGIPN